MRRGVGQTEKETIMTIRTASIVVILAGLMSTAVAADIDTLNIECRLETVPSTDLRSMSLVFYRTHPPSAKTEEILRTFLITFSSLYPDKDIVAKAWSSPTGRELDERSIPLKDGSTALFYRTATKIIETSNQASGARSKTVSDSQKEYSVKYEEKTFPAGNMASLQVVFKSPPKETEIYTILVDELRKAMSSQSPKLKTTAYAYTGDLSNPSGMKQIRGSDRVYMRGECNPADGRILSKNLRTGRTRVFGQLKP